MAAFLVANPPLRWGKPSGGGINRQTASQRDFLEHFLNENGPSICRNLARFAGPVPPYGLCPRYRPAHSVAAALALGRAAASPWCGGRSPGLGASRPDRCTDRFAAPRLHDPLGQFPPDARQGGQLRPIGLVDVDLKSGRLGISPLDLHRPVRRTAMTEPPADHRQ